MLSYPEAVAHIAARFSLSVSQVKVYALRWDCHRQPQPAGRVSVQRERQQCLRCRNWFFPPFKLVDGRVRVLARVCRACKQTEDWLSGGAEYDTSGWADE
ncbi:MAG: hypothetical protein KGI71_04650 [Patescibacteria group bacterium]|nr:hypothetical protein [Patescibacteria group bacterium]